MQDIKIDFKEVEDTLSSLISALSAKECGARAGYLKKDLGKKPNSSRITLEKLALTHNFGTTSIPARPFLSRAQQEAVFRIKNLVRLRIDQGTSLKQICKEAGLILQSEIKYQIVKGNFTPNALSTIKRKKSARPLVDTGNLLQSVHYSVITKDGEKIDS